VAAPARRAAKALGPVPSKSCIVCSVCIAAATVHEFGHRKPRMKLHSVHRHSPPPVSVNLFSIFAR
jgi:hypothetical protein